MRRLRAPRLLIGLAALVSLTLLAVFGLAGQRSDGQVAKPLPRQTLVGPPVTLAALRGKPVLVVFWASWCDSCMHEAPAIERFARSPRGRGRIVGVDWSDALSGARAFIEHYGWTFPNFRDAEGTVGEDYGLTDLPTTFVVDGHGRIRTSLRGPQTEQTLSHALAQL